MGSGVSAIIHGHRHRDIALGVRNTIGWVSTTDSENAEHITLQEEWIATVLEVHKGPVGIIGDDEGTMTHVVASLPDPQK
eukprot:Nk52_evm1s1344 gene=Nk52_evmTU1s1344